MFLRIHCSRRRVEARLAEFVREGNRPMADCCQDKASPYDIREEEHELIRAAIQLGEWLAAQAEATVTQQVAIAKILEFLRNLPAPPPPGLHGEFGFRYDYAGENVGHCGSWMVSVCRTTFEIFSNGREELPEFEWLLCPGATNHNNLSAAPAWIAQVSNPRALAIPNRIMVVEASTWSVSP